LASYWKRGVCKGWVVVEAVICEPVSDPTTGINRANSRIQALFVIAQDKLTLCRWRFC
jgi:hypothetical protein